MKLLSLYYTHKPGGFCKRLYRLLSALAERGHTVVYLTLDPPPPALSSKVQVQIIPFPFKQRRGALFWPLFTVWCPIYAAWSVRTIRPERYVIFGPYYSSMLVFARKVVPVESVLFLRSMLFWVHKNAKQFSLLNAVAGMVDRFGMLSATRLVCLTQVMAAAVRKCTGKENLKIEVLSNDVPTSAKKRAKIADSEGSATLSLLTSGVIDADKNIALIIQAIASLPSEYQERVLLIVAGEGTARAQLEEESKRRVPGRVRFLGWVSELGSVYPEVDLVVHPSLHEGMPNSVLEALGADLPVLVSNTPELAELVPYELARFSPTDANELAERLIQLLDSAEALSKLAALCAARAQELSFNWEEKACLIVEES